MTFMMPRKIFISLEFIPIEVNVSSIILSFALLLKIEINKINTIGKK